MKSQMSTDLTDVNVLQYHLKHRVVGTQIYVNEITHSLLKIGIDETVPYFIKYDDSVLNTLRLRKMDAILQTTFSNASQNFVVKGLINNILALVEIIAWRRPGDKPLS